MEGLQRAVRSEHTDACFPFVPTVEWPAQLCVAMPYLS